MSCGEVHACARTHACTHTRTHAHTHARTHTHTPCTHARTHAHTHGRTCTHTHTGYTHKEYTPEQQIISLDTTTQIIKSLMLMLLFDSLYQYHICML